MNGQETDIKELLHYFLKENKKSNRKADPWINILQYQLNDDKSLEIFEKNKKVRK